jgi:hypothetical protein
MGDEGKAVSFLTWADGFAVCALAPTYASATADYVRFTPKADICGAANSSLFDHFVGEAKQRDRKNQTKFVGRFHIDGKVHPRGLLDGHFGWLCPIQDFANVNANQSISIKKARPIGHQSARSRVLVPSIDCRQQMLSRTRDNLIAPAKKEQVCAHKEDIRSSLH